MRVTGIESSVDKPKKGEVAGLHAFKLFPLIFLFFIYFNSLVLSRKTNVTSLGERQPRPSCATQCLGFKWIWTISVIVARSRGESRDQKLDCNEVFKN